MSADKLKALRERKGLSQVELAKRAGVSRQMVGALEAGRHLPRVDAALALAATLGAKVDDLFGPSLAPVDVISGRQPEEGAVVRIGQVGLRIVCSQARVETSGWDIADGVVEQGEVSRLSSLAPGVVMVGCEPGLEVLERNLREGGRGAMAVGCSNSVAVEALEAGRAHVAVVHATSAAMPLPSITSDRFRLCSWRIGLAAPADAGSDWAREALGGSTPVVQRESGAGVQQAFEKAAGKKVPGPISSGHIEAVRLALAIGAVAVTIEPAALALGAEFHPLDTHQAEIWVPRKYAGEPDLEAFLGEVCGERFNRRLRSVGGYDLAGIGTRAA